MKNHYLKSLSAIALAGVFAINANAETISEEFIIDFSQKEDGFKLNSYWGGPQDKMSLAEAPDGTKAVLISGVTITEDGSEAVNEAGYPAWNTKARYEGLTLPKGYNFSNVSLIEVTYMPTQPDNVPFGIQLKQTTNFLTYDDVVTVNEWNTLAFDPSAFTHEDGSEYTGTPTSFDFCMGADGSSNYYIQNVTFYLEKEVTQREKDEAALDKETAACVEFNFDNWEVSGPGEDGAFSSPYLGSNGGGVNRTDMIIDKGPEGYDNNCAHIIYGGWTQVFITDAVKVPEGYTFDDLRLIEYDIYETELQGEDANSGSTFPGRNGAPILKMKESYAWGWCPNNNGSACGNAALPSVNEWHHVEFYPSAYEWAETTVKKDVLDENGNVKTDEEGNPIQEDVTWTSDQTRDEFGKLTSFNISIGFFPCLNQCYVDNVKLWFQKSGSQSGVEGIEEEVAEPETVNVYNLQGICVLRNADKAAVNNLPAGLYIVNGKKYMVK